MLFLLTDYKEQALILSEYYFLLKSYNSLKIAIVKFRFLNNLDLGKWFASVSLD